MEASGAKSPENGESESDDDGYSWPQRIRWGLALIVAIIGGAFLLIGAEEQTLCHGAVAAGGSKAVELCEAPGLTQLLPFVMVIVLLLAPDLSELAIPGLLSIKRKIEEQGKRQARIEAELVRVEQNVRFNATTSLAVHNHGIGAVDLAALERKQAQFEAELEELKSSPQGNTPPEEPPPPGTPAVPPPPPDEDGGAGGAEAPSPNEEESHEGSGVEERDHAVAGEVSDEEDQRASLTLQLLWLVKNLEQYEAISRVRRVDPSEKMAHLSEEQQERVDRWHNLFGEELAAAKEVRNAVAHNPYAASIEELQEATRIGRRLMRILLTGLGTSTEQIDRLEES